MCKHKEISGCTLVKWSQIAQDIQNKDGPVTFLLSSILNSVQGKALKREKQLKKAVPFIRASCCVLLKDQWQSQVEQQQRWEWNIGGKRVSLMDPLSHLIPYPISAFLRNRS